VQRHVIRTCEGPRRLRRPVVVASGGTDAARRCAAPPAAASACGTAIEREEGRDAVEGERWMRSGKEEWTEGLGLGVVRYDLKKCSLFQNMQHALLQLQHVLGAVIFRSDNVCR
jgi:hypothetical protein